MRKRALAGSQGQHWPLPAVSLQREYGRFISASASAERNKFT